MRNHHTDFYTFELFPPAKLIRPGNIASLRNSLMNLCWNQQHSLLYTSTNILERNMLNLVLLFPLDTNTK